MNVETVFKFLSFFIIGSKNRKIFRNFFQKPYSLSEHCYFESLNYKIIPLGSYCLPRVITSRAKLKPLKRYGELTLPFDLSFHNDIDAVIQMLETDFENFFYGVEYDNENKYFINKKRSAIYNHEGYCNYKDFVKLYTKRIENFREYVNLDKHIFFMMAIHQKIDTEKITRIYEVLDKARKNKMFSLIIINHNKQRLAYGNNPSILIINQEFPLSEKWPDEFNTPKGTIFYNNIVDPVKEFIKCRV